ncbi:hypothetical protein BpHYR1_004008 [Brachionus plicatilis]|uniref:Uncharacterized protein n=1 Tax=Brachionus plicatilis TaxID=10195 RepID=A0A3M7T0S4_BRAPC|nr:hypothetical protein BpHYR1_004008 [Brachionus plicatilis]
MLTTEEYLLKYFSLVKQTSFLMLIPNNLGLLDNQTSSLNFASSFVPVWVQDIFLKDDRKICGDYFIQTVWSIIK